MAQFNYGFYVKDPATTPDQLKTALEAKYPTFKAYFRSEIINIGAKNKNGVSINRFYSSINTSERDKNHLRWENIKRG